MKRKPAYTPEQVEILKSNPYTHYVSQYTLVFTLEFKQFFWEKLKEPGMNAPKIFRLAGYDTSMLTKSKIDRTLEGIKAEAASPDGLQPPHAKSEAERAKAFAAKDLSRQRTEKSLKELQDRIVYLEKQIEFLKKISNLNP